VDQKESQHAAWFEWRLLLERGVVICGAAALVVSYAVLFLLCVCVCDLFLFNPSPGPFTPSSGPPHRWYDQFTPFSIQPRVNPRLILTLEPVCGLFLCL